MFLEVPATQLVYPEIVQPDTCLFMELMASKKFKKKCCKKYKKGKRCKRCPGRME